MRRVCALLLALMLVFSLSIGAFAAEGAVDSTADYVSAERTADITIKKLYTVTGASKTNLFPAEVLNFTVTGDSKNPDETKLIVEPLTVTGNTNQTLTVKLPSYTKVGTYKYTITETPEKQMQGVTYSGEAVAVTVLVTYNYDGKCLNTEIVLGTGTAAAGKLDTFTNKYDVGTLTLEKTVDGNLGAKDVYFDIAVTFTAEKEVASAITVTGGSNAANPTTIAAAQWGKEEGSAAYTCTKTFKLKHTDKLTFSDIPAGVTYAVVEDAKHGEGNDGFDVNSAGDTDYTIAYTGEKGTIAAGETAQAKVLNTKETSVQTGVLLDSMPYVLMVTAAVAGLILVFGKKRFEM